MSYIVQLDYLSPVMAMPWTMWRCRNMYMTRTGIMLATTMAMTTL